MVKLQFRIIRKPYKNGSRIYEHEEVSLNFPKELHELLRCMRDHKLEVKGRREGKIIHIMLTEKEDS